MIIQKVPPRPLQPRVPASATIDPPVPLAAQVQNVIARKPVPGLAGIEIFNTADVTNNYFRCLLYSEVSAGKTTAAARFGPPADVRIILTRRKEQLIPLRRMGYTAAHCPTADKVRTALLYPEKLFGAEWAARPDCTLILDDLTYFKDLELEENETRVIEVAGREREVSVRDIRQVHGAAKGIMWDYICRGVILKPMHFIAVALSRSWFPNPKEQRITPDLPPKMMDMLHTDFEYVFYIDKSRKKIITNETWESTDIKNDKGQMEKYKRMIFARHKIDLELVNTGLITELEDLDLRSIWNRVKAGSR